MNADPFPRVKSRGTLVHLLRNRAVDLVRLQSTHASVESVLVETIEWVKNVKRQRINSVDQELYHFIDAIHASPRSTETEIYAAVLVTDNVATSLSNDDVTLQAAEETIAETAALRQDFLSNVFKRSGMSDVQVVAETELDARTSQAFRYAR
jgi:hypothetical protein